MQYIMQDIVHSAGSALILQETSHVSCKCTRTLQDSAASALILQETSHVSCKSTRTLQDLGKNSYYLAENIKNARILQDTCKDLQDLARKFCMGIITNCST